MDEAVITPPEPDQRLAESRSFWREMGKTLVRESIPTIDGTARQLIVVTGIIEGLYFHAIAFSDLRGQVAGGTLLVYLLPVVLLLMSLIAALTVFIPDRYRLNFSSSDACKLVYERVVKSKLLALRGSRRGGTARGWRRCF